MNRALPLLVLAGEAIFLLPFVLPRVFRPTLLAAFDITNLELGSYFSAYGLVAIGAYLFGGPIADRFLPNRLMAVALCSTAAGGFYMATLPPSGHLLPLYAFWGLTTILLFWAAMLRATRIAGGENRQGFAFGTLEAGRGLVSALVAFGGVYVLAHFFVSELSDVEALRSGIRAVILTFSAIVLLVGVAVWWGLSGLDSRDATGHRRLPWDEVLQLSRKPQLWLLALIVLCAYSGYRVLDDVSLLASDALEYSDVEAARLGSISLLLRPVAALAGGLAADRLSASRISLFAFALMLLGCAVVALWPPVTMTAVAVWLAVVLAGLGVYALRGLYFALVAEARVPVALTGTAVGLVSVIGYLPDVFMPPLMGVLLDGWPGVAGHRLVFGLGIGFGVVGLLGGITFRRLPSR